MHTHKHTHTLSLSVRPFCKYIRSTELSEGTVSLRQSWAQTQFSFKGKMNLHMSDLQIRPQLVLACVACTLLLAAKIVMACVDRAWQFTPGHHKIKLRATEDENLNVHWDAHHFEKWQVLVQNGSQKKNSIKMITAQFVTVIDCNKLCNPHSYCCYACEGADAVYNNNHDVGRCTTWKFLLIFETIGSSFQTEIDKSSVLCRQMSVFYHNNSQWPVFQL